MVSGTLGDVDGAIQWMERFGRGFGRLASCADSGNR
jgi:hypothetical protein